MMPRHAAALALVAALSVAACTADDPSTVQPQATGTPSGTGGATPPALPTTAAPKPTLHPVLTTDLADGKHYAYVTKLDTKNFVLTVDVVQFLTGEEAEKAAQEDGEEAFDYYIRNQNPKLRQLSVAEDVKVVTNTLTAEESGSSSKDVAITLEKLASFVKSGQAKGRLFWFQLKGSRIVRIQEQYLP